MMFSSRASRLLISGALIVGAVALTTRVGDAHKPITSKYTYNDDVFPIVREKCARCHVDDGVAPMSLMTYEAAIPWAESIRAELIASHMPPWIAEAGFGQFKNEHRLTAKELDVILTWATGGNPRGALDQTLPKVALNNEWTMGAPDLKLPLPAAFTLAADKMEDTPEFILATGTTEARWVRAVDLLPGTPAIVRSAVIYVKREKTSDVPRDFGPAAAIEPDHVLERWLPGQDPEPIDNGTAFKLPAGAELSVRIHYKKTWQFEGKPMTDRSTVGVYFAPEKSAQELLVVQVALPENAAPKDKMLSFTQTIDQDVQALAVTPDQVAPNITLQVEAVLPDGSRTPMIRLNTRADWTRRYWFDKPITIPRGTKIKVTANLEDPDLLSSAFGGPLAPKPAQPSAMRLTLDVIRSNAKPYAP